MTTPEDRWRESKTDAQEQRADNLRNEYRGVVWISLSRLISLVKKLRNKRNTPPQ